MSSGTNNAMFSNGFLTYYDGNYTGLGEPEDTVGNGVAETVFTINGVSFTVDGIATPRTTPNFPNGAADLWDPTDVGCLWDSTNPDVFPDPLGL